MTPTLKLVIYMALLTWLTLLAASLIRARAWTFAGTMIAFGNRDNLPAATALAGRAERTARNTLENFVLFAAIGGSPGLNELEFTASQGPVSATKTVQVLI